QNRPSFREEREWRSDVHRRRRVEGLAEAGRLGSQGFQPTTEDRSPGRVLVAFEGCLPRQASLARRLLPHQVPEARSPGWGMKDHACSSSINGGILKWYDDVQMCGYQDVQVTWEILTRCEMET
ncbi:hypothetical protein MUK42_33752, partial [Musa troglodytarum]